VKWAVVIRPRAEADLREARQWYENQRSGLGDKFLDEVKRAVLSLADQPTQRPPYYRDFRRVLLRRFPYKLFYRIEEDRVIVFRILHAKRDHRRWL
jgi:plasmid stabilization system protein ParE